MEFRRVSVVATPPIDTTRARKALRIRSAFEDDILANKLQAAEELICAKTGHVLRETRFRITLDRAHDEERRYFCEGELDLPGFPFREVESVEFLASPGVWSTLDPASYDARTMHRGGELYLFSDAVIPAAIAGRPNMRVEFSAGYGSRTDTDPELRLPARVEELALMLAGHWMEHREAVTSGDLAEVPLSAGLLFEELRIFT